MAATVYCAAVTSMDAEIITLKTKITAGVSYFIARLPDDAVKESLFRVLFCDLKERGLITVICTPRK
jgi:hypothetical protein